MKTTADSLNRLKDKERIENTLGLSECGNRENKFYSSKGLLLAIGYIRIVYGDHGPFLEFKKNQVQINNLRCDRKGIGYYNKWCPKDKSGALFYEQLRTVENLPNPPKGKYSERHNRKEGYADYRVGRWYVSPDDIRVQNIKRLLPHLQKFARG